MIGVVFEAGVGFWGRGVVLGQWGAYWIAGCVSRQILRVQFQLQTIPGGALVFGQFGFGSTADEEDLIGG